MKLKDVTDVLKFAAFRPEADDASASWLRRFPNKRTLLLNIGKNRTTWRCLGRGGRILESGSQRGDFKDMAASLAPDWRKLADDGWCGVSLNSRYVISLESNLPRKPGIENLMRTNPRAVLGSKIERNKRYALTNNPEHTTSIVLSCDEEVIKKIEATLTEIGLHAGRICCGTYTMLRRAIEYANGGAPVAEGVTPSVNFLYLVCCEGSVCILTQTGEVWSDLRSRSDFYDEDITPILEMIAASRQADDLQSAELLFMADEPRPDIIARLTGQFPSLKITDLTQPDHLWSLLADKPV